MQNKPTHSAFKFMQQVTHILADKLLYEHKKLASIYSYLLTDLMQ